jgi:hypothetical protein
MLAEDEGMMSQVMLVENVRCVRALDARVQDRLR